MKNATKTTLITTAAAAAILTMTTGCGMTVVGPCDDGSYEETVVIDYSPYVNTWLSIPGEVKRLIAPRVEGYFSPRLSRYDNYLYPSDLAYNGNDLPCFVKADYNGDGYSDYAFLFSREEWEWDTWYLTTKMVVVLSTRTGWTIGADMVLGTVTGDESIPVEEYWGIYRINAGTHTYTTELNNATVTKTITLYEDAFFLASLDPAEEAIFYADGYDVYEMSLTSPLAKRAALAKKADTTEKRIIPFNKKVEGRSRIIK